MRDLSAPISFSAPARWAARPARITTAAHLAPAALFFLPALAVLGLALLCDALVPGDPYAQQTGLFGWIAPPHGGPQ